MQRSVVAPLSDLRLGRVPNQQSVDTASLPTPQHMRGDQVLPQGNRTQFVTEGPKQMQGEVLPGAGEWGSRRWTRRHRQ